MKRRIAKSVETLKRMACRRPRTTVFRPLHAPLHTRRAFTLVELLVVIAIIGILAALIIPGISKIMAIKARNKTMTELKQVESWIVDYKTKRGYYPPDNPGNKYFINQLYYELAGTVFSNGDYTTLDGNATVAQGILPLAFGATSTVNGFMNTSKGARDEGLSAQKFLIGSKTPQVAEMKSRLKVLVGSVGWDTSLPYQPIPQFPNGPARDPGVNPFRYVSTNPTNNPNSFDLWIDIYVQGKTYRICNWSENPVAL